MRSTLNENIKFDRTDLIHNARFHNEPIIFKEFLKLELRWFYFGVKHFYTGLFSGWFYTGGGGGEAQSARGLFL